MSRYRPPRPRASAYITPAGHARLQAELKLLWKVTRPEVTRRVSEAAAMGDRSENAEYIYGKKQLREIDARVRFLSKRLDELEVVDRPPGDRSRAFFGAWLTVADENGAEHCYRVVGPDEIGDAREYISIDSPMARALVGKRVGDTIILERADTSHEYEVVAISYDPPTGSASPAV